MFDAATKIIRMEPLPLHATLATKGHAHHVALIPASGRRPSTRVRDYARHGDCEQRRRCSSDRAKWGRGFAGAAQRGEREAVQAADAMRAGKSTFFPSPSSLLSKIPQIVSAWKILFSLLLHPMLNPTTFSLT
jgi:hypothetical protein